MKLCTANFLLTAFLGFVGCQSPSAVSEQAGGAPAPPPNIIFIVADDLGCYGQQLTTTPYLDRMATEGIRFTQHYAGNTVCAPSQAALMTGQHMGHAEVRGNGQVAPSGQTPLSDSLITVAALLQRGGYETVLIGKWGLGNVGTTGAPFRRLFYQHSLGEALLFNNPLKQVHTFR